jgi:hypothetical protein
MTNFVEGIARVCYEVNRAYCQAIDDWDFPPWTEAPQWAKDTCMDGVRFHLDNPKATVSQSHENWLKKKEEEGWTYGEVKDTELKKHPCIVPFDELPEKQRAKDYIFRQIVHSCVGLLNQEMLIEFYLKPKGKK